MWKKFFAVVLVWGMCLVSGSVVRAQTRTDFQEFYSADLQTNLRADIVTYDLIPPDEFELLSPVDGSQPCSERPTFSWEQSRDNKSVIYDFHLQFTSSAGDRQELLKTFTGPFENDEYEVWTEDGHYFLRFKNSFGYGDYQWWIVARDPSDNKTESSHWSFQYLASVCADCEQAEVMSGVTLAAPSGVVGDRLPAIKVNFTAGDQVQTFSVLVDGLVAFDDVEITTRTTSAYNVSRFDDSFVFQPFYAYLPQKNGDAVSYVLTVRVMDINGCSKDLKTTLAYGSATTRALVPQLISPVEGAIFYNPVNTFVWDVNVAGNTLSSQSFILNGVTLFRLPAVAATTDDYVLTVDVVEQTEKGTTYRYTLRLLKDYYLVDGERVSVVHNNAADNTDWNRWRVSVTTPNNLSAISSVYRFRYLSLTQATYYWCTGQNSCAAGTLSQCLASGRNCYYGSSSVCSANAAQDCGPNPPLRTYHWCANQNTCDRGTLEQCLQTGKNCFIDENNIDGTGCLQNAAAECSPDARYVWCTSSLSCAHGTYSQCLETGKPCHLDIQGGSSCPSEVSGDCLQAVVSDNPFLQIVFDSLLNYFDLPLDAAVLLEVLSTRVFPVISLVLFLPLGLLVIFFPRPRGRVFDAQTKRGVAGALVVAINGEGHFVAAAITNRWGYYQGLKLTPGDYTLTVSQADYVFPTKTPRHIHQTIKNFYLGDAFRVRSEFSSVFTHQIPVDLQPAIIEAMSDSERRRRERLHPWSTLWRGLSAIINWASACWQISFLLVIVVTLIYPMFLNLLILAVYIVGACRRLFAVRHRHNVTGVVLGTNGKPFSELMLEFRQVAYDQLVGRVATDRKGRFKFHLNSSQSYTLRAPGAEFIELDGVQTVLQLNFDANNKLNEQLVARKINEN